MLNIFNKTNKTKQFKYNNIYRAKKYNEDRYVTIYGVVNKNNKLYAISHWNTTFSTGWKLINIDLLELFNYPKCTSKVFNVINSDREILMNVEITGFYINKEGKLVARLRGSNEISVTKLQDPMDPTKYPNDES